MIFSEHICIIEEKDILQLHNKVLPFAEKKFVDLKNVEVAPSLVHKFMLAGFLPANFRQQPEQEWLATCWLADIHVTGNPLGEEELEWWTRGKANFYHARRWVFGTVSLYKEKAIKEGGSLGLFLTCPSLLYKSNRPRTDMSCFRTVFSRKEIPEGWSALPVTRYAEGMSKGLYYKDRPKDVHGTFYYHEPESTTFLIFKRSKIFFNKTECYRKLAGEDPLKTNPKILKHISGEIPENLLIEGRYIGYADDLYAKEDYLDQDICLLGREMKLDVIVLTHMVGKYQVVTEVLDCRDRAVSYQHLIFT